MCYNAAQLALKIYKEAKRLQASEAEIEYLKKRWEKLEKGGKANFYQVSGFAHPELAAFRNDDGKLRIDKYIWGLIPHWVKSELQAKEIQEKTLNARGETLFEKASFRDAATSGRIILPLNGFFEHHHKNGKTFPYYIERSDKQRMLVGAIASSWIHPTSQEETKSLSIVTTKGNETMAFIHNNPKMKEARMPLILDDSDCEQWLLGNQQDAEALILPNKNIELATKTVRRINGKNAVGNIPEVQEEYIYDELIEPLTLF